MANEPLDIDVGDWVRIQRHYKKKESDTVTVSIIVGRVLKITKHMFTVVVKREGSFEVGDVTPTEPTYADGYAAESYYRSNGCMRMPFTNPVFSKLYAHHRPKVIEIVRKK